MAESMRAPLVSVVIPLYNKEDTIVRAIQSVFIQYFESLEIIVVDDGSTDGSVGRVRDLNDSRIRLVRQANAGPGIARNEGAKLAQGEILAFLDADDEWLPGFLERGCKAFEEEKDIVAYVSAYDTGVFSLHVPDKVSKITSVPKALSPPSGSLGDDEFRNYLNGFHSSSTLVRAKVFFLAGGFFDRYRCLWGEDSFLWIQILFSGRVFWDPVARVRYHIEDSSLGHAVRFHDTARPMVKFSSDLEKRVPPKDRVVMRSIIRCFAQEDARELASAGCFFDSVSLRIKFGMLNPVDIIEDVRCALRHFRRSFNNGVLK